MNINSLIHHLCECKNPLCLAFIGLAIGFTFYYQNVFYVFSIILILALLVLSFIRRKYFLILILSIAFGFYYPNIHFKYLSPNLDEMLDTRFTFVGEILSEADNRSPFAKKYYFRIKKVLSSNDFLNTKVQVIGSRYEEYSPGDIVQIKGRLKIPKSAKEPGGFDQKKYLQVKSIKYILKSDQGTLVFLDSPPSTMFRRFISAFRNKLIGLSKEYIHGDNNNLVNGIVFGAKASNLNKTLKNKIRNLGLAHITSASGFNVSILAAFIFYLFKIFTKNKYLPSIVSIFTVLLYASLADFSSSVIRATVLIILALMGSMFNKKLKILPAISLLLISFFALEPYSILDIGLQLSVVAFLGIVLFYVPVHRWLKSKLNILFLFIAAIFFQSLIAQFMVMPLIIFYFHNFQWMGLISNMLAVPLAAIILVLGLTSIPFAFFCLPIYQLICYFLSFFASFFILWMKFLSH